MALHAKAKAEAGYRFYALYDKIFRDDILAHACAQCRSNKGAPGVDGEEFADVEAYGVERWLGELALAHARRGARGQQVGHEQLQHAVARERWRVSAGESACQQCNISGEYRGA